MEMNSLIDVRALLPAIRVPTLVVNRGTDFDVQRRGGPLHRRADPRRALRRAARSRSLRRRSTRIRSSTSSSRSWPNAARRACPRDDDRVLVTLLVTDIVGSAQSDSRRVVRATELARFRGRELEAPGDGTLATFDGPARAVRCATRDRARAPAARSRRPCRGAHRRGRGARAIASAASRCTSPPRVAAEAAPGEVLVSQTVNDLVAGSGLEFADRGSRALAGVPGEWRLLAVVDVARI